MHHSHPVNIKGEGYPLKEESKLGVWTQQGVEPSSWPVPEVAHDPASTFAAEKVQWVVFRWPGDDHGNDDPFRIDSESPVMS